MTDYTREATAVAEAINSIYERKENKKIDISGDYSGDNISYPTVQGVKALLSSEYFSKTEINTLLSSYVTCTALNNLLALKVDYTDIIDNLNSTEVGKPLSANQGRVLKTLVDGKEISISKQNVADTGYASTYVISQGGVPLSPKINIEKDKMLRSISIETVGATPTQEEIDHGLSTGDKYFLFIVNTVDGDGTTRLILPITDVFDLQSADEITLTLNASGVFSVKNGGVGLSQISQSVVDSWLSVSDVRDEIGTFASALAEAINPSQGD